MSWVAIDRAIRIADRRGLPADLRRWADTRNAIFAWIMERGWSGQRQAFIQAEGSDVLDASLLLMPLVRFIAPTDPRWLSTLDAIGKDLVTDSLVYRYDPAASPDGLDGAEGTFSMCSFWYVECLAFAGRLDEAQLAFEKMLTYANHVGLYSEQIGSSGELLGNFPQAFTHLALISAAIEARPRPPIGTRVRLASQAATGTRDTMIRRRVGLCGAKRVGWLRRAARIAGTMPAIAPIRSPAPMAPIARDRNHDGPCLVWA